MIQINIEMEYYFYSKAFRLFIKPNNKIIIIIL